MACFWMGGPSQPIPRVRRRGLPRPWRAPGTSCSRWAIRRAPAPRGTCLHPCARLPRGRPEPNSRRRSSCRRRRRRPSRRAALGRLVVGRPAALDPSPPDRGLSSHRRMVRDLVSTQSPRRGPQLQTGTAFLYLARRNQRTITPPIPPQQEISLADLTRPSLPPPVSCGQWSGRARGHLQPSLPRNGRPGPHWLRRQDHTRNPQQIAGRHQDHGCRPR